MSGCIKNVFSSNRVFSYFECSSSQCILVIACNQIVRGFFSWSNNDVHIESISWLLFRNVNQRFFQSRLKNTFDSL